MQNTVSLSQYVRKRNGVALGASHSMRNMLSRSFGAGSFPVFWHYWNPIWGYYLSRYIMKPLGLLLPSWQAVIFTFLVSGALHDLAVSLVKWKVVIFFTPWFFLMGIAVVLSKYFSISYRSYPWFVRAAINILFIGSTLLATCFVEGKYA
ncbi:MBOAT family O-acyltransferase [Shewanella cyperi]|uniref:MBOAT family O-acyltransferase n=1 Tax=Shewanella cyperi TaxID=2814292 RepID=UPI001A948DA6|nr:MBOAT family O-acyltransferase [Shewanella cyperi]QSX39406.1 acyltransferase [Shewanella cyperi]